ncbi:cytochrome C [Desulfuromonas acetoxidans]|uniref:Cytochrome c family protein n=1 Tax=Desulfuromonas acetoxidans (strain DSM 684 / 11070) TaxID=281689 RepID=Q1JVM3_DESA6|nr:selenite/tellurite reduction operon c-type cytochrome ExtM [Desulfuromonas acetoxidans]EAT14298.1 cytochrome c family protein [Desulfuromonas acetoxidans DSM 684]MBF0646221.1 cytochrome C [Desulfuromonas acetoxidans]NVD25065.1 cytochrome C [Desulfuromonas acetoxidans]NVE17110.1 cytochrome C [Desulfuromonas acetoxidans]
MIRVLIAIFFLLPFLLVGCGSQSTTSQCEYCHAGLELASDTHQNCIDCHGGDETLTDKKAAHASMYGPRNPSAPKFWEKTCGKCHQYQLDRVRSNLMLTNTGFIKNIRLTWEGGEEYLYATQDQKLYDAQGNPVEHHSVLKLRNLAGELYRKYCSLCHVGMESHRSWKASHASGCAACHFPFNENGTYQGNDLAMKNKWPHSASHQMEPLPTNEVCFRCHNRSGRIALSYQGMNDGNNGLVPVNNGFPGPELISGARNVTHIQGDIHFDKGMDCIDCHTSRDVMGDGYAYENMYQQTEVACEDCHGSGDEGPRYEVVERENHDAVRESRNYQRQVKTGDKLVLTSKGRPYSNVFYQDGKIVVVGKRDGQEHISKQIAATPEHTIVGHERMECYACHSAAVPQCFGCHTQYDQSQKGMDFVRGRETRGKFSETEDYRSLYPFSLALDQRGKIAPMTPGCQTFVTVLDRRGNVQKEEYVANFRGKQQLRFAPFYSHNTALKAVSCRECHADPAFLGFGQHVVAGQSVESTLICEKSDELPLDGFMVMKQGEVQSFSAVVREHSRPLNEHEVRRALMVNQCLVCHDDPKDAIYQQALDYDQIDRCLQRVTPDR